MTTALVDEQDRLAQIASIANTEYLPTLPQVAIELINLAKDPDPDFDRVITVVQSDPAICAKILKVCNSALLGFRPRVQNIPDAVHKLGLNMIRTLILGFYLSDNVNSLVKSSHWEQHWRCSITQAVLAELIAKRISMDPSVCFLAALLQDIGILAFLAERHDEYAANVLKFRKLPDVVNAELSHFGFTHIDVSREIINKWGLCSTFETAVSTHHNQVFTSSNPLSTVCRASTLGATVLFAGTNKGLVNTKLIEWMEFTKEHFQLSVEDCGDMLCEVNELVDDYAAIFQFDVRRDLRSERILLLARDLIQQIAIEEQLNSATKKKRKQADDDLYLDDLSTAFNRKYLNERIPGILTDCEQKGEPVSLAFLDLDDFKSVNDTHGHLVGDMAITHVAKWLKASVRKNDIVIRFGGDEFLVFLRDAKAEEFQAFSERVSAIPPLKIENHDSIQLSLSIGGVFWASQKNKGKLDINRLIQKADQLMFQAKRSASPTPHIAIENS